MSLTRSGALKNLESVTGNIEFYTLYTKLNITATGDYNDSTQKRFREHSAGNRSQGNAYNYE